MNETTDREQINAIVNRHIARIMTDLEEAGVPALLSDAIKSRLQWLRSDLYKRTNGDQQNDILHRPNA